MAAEYGWDHLHIRTRFTRRQLQLYIDKLCARHKRQADLVKKIQKQPRDDGYESGWVSSSQDWAEARKRGEVTYIGH